jgi:hypothetical protein
LYSAKEKLEIVSARGEAAPFALPPHPSRAKRGEGMQFELFLKYTANVREDTWCLIGDS